jgi:glycosyltransferase involved in cell wall biosynthesis
MTLATPVDQNWSQSSHGGVQRVPPRIAILSNYPVDLTSYVGGVETSTAALLEGLTAYSNEFEFHVLSGSNAIPKDVHQRHNGIWFHFLGGLHRPWVRPRLPLRIVKAYRFLRSLRPALVHCQANPDLAMAAVLAEHRPLLTIHGVADHEAHLRTGWEYWSTHSHALVGKLVAPHVGAYICISQYVADTLQQPHPKFSIPNAVSSTFLTAHHENRCDSPLIMFVGALGPLKRPADLIDAHARLRSEFPDLETVVCGPVEDQGYARALHRDIEARSICGITFAGSIGPQRVAQLLERASVLVLPSAQENAPMAIAEAMAVGVPVVATSVGGVPEMVQDGATGLLYAPGDVSALVDHIAHILRDPGLRERLGARARDVALSRYAPASVAAATTEVYRSLLNLPSAYPQDGHVAREH